MVVKIFRKYEICGKRDDVGTVEGPGKFTVGLDGSGNVFLKHNEQCNTTMTCIDRNFKKGYKIFMCPKCNIRKIIK